ncbi:metal-sulfur cluster assembly factor [Levilactobacillus andaensis]|uniref:metal-sulfur cluster assembly factor n=1 Tax=Levilactobacillus andaensis TaxID=2799570 RepID=UPI001941A356|nr:metal-sulfur cluster assembly factor [Levilactobacillus andaensis]
MAENEQAEEAVMTALEGVIDPELTIDIVNLGLIYGVTVEGNKCTVKMTLTTMGCPLSDMLNDQITAAALSVAGVEHCDIDLVWEPAWDMGQMTRYAKVSLGVHG